MPDDRDPAHDLAEIVHLVAEQPAAERAKLLDRLCAGDLDLRRDVVAALTREETNDLAQPPKT